MTKAINPTALVGFDYFEDMFDPFDIDDFELERFMLRVFKVISMILLEQGNVAKLEQDIIFQIDQKNGGAVAYQKDTMVDLGFQLRDYETAR